MGWSLGFGIRNGAKVTASSSDGLSMHWWESHWPLALPQGKSYSMVSTDVVSAGYSSVAVSYAYHLLFVRPELLLER